MLSSFDTRADYYNDDIDVNPVIFVDLIYNMLGGKFIIHTRERQRRGVILQ